MKIKDLKFIVTFRDPFNEIATIETPFFSGTIPEVKQQINAFFEKNGKPYGAYEIACSYDENYFSENNNTNFTVSGIGVKFYPNNTDPFVLSINNRGEARFATWFEAVREFFKFYLRKTITRTLDRFN